MPKTKTPKQPRKGDASRKKNLTPKQQKFADLYLELGNASEAYRRAYSAARMAQKTIGKRAQELLNHGAVAGYIDGIKKPAQKAVAAKFEVTLEAMTSLLLLDRKDAEKLELTPSAITVRKETVMAIAKLNGLVIDTVNNINEKYVVGVERLLSDGGFESKYKLNGSAHLGAHA